MVQTLDIGCGSNAKEHIKRGLVGLDLKRGLCDIQGSAYNLPFKNDVFDKVIMSHVLEHLDCFGFALEEIKRVLHHRGILEIEVPNPSAFWIFKDYVFSRKPLLNATGINKMHVCSFGEAELQNIMRIKGFITLKASYCNSSHYRKVIEESSLFHRVFYRFLFRFFPAFQTALSIHARLD